MLKCVLLLCATLCASAKKGCINSAKLEMGVWSRDLRRMDTIVVQHAPVTTREGEVYVYENDFPNRTIKYLHVDNVAIKTCGASASVKTGGVGTSSVMITLHAPPNNEIRSVIDIWGTKAVPRPKHVRQTPKALKHMKSLYLSSNKHKLYQNKNW